MDICVDVHFMVSEVNVDNKGIPSIKIKEVHGSIVLTKGHIDRNNGERNVREIVRILEDRRVSIDGTSDGHVLINL